MYIHTYPPQGVWLAGLLPAAPVDSRPSSEPSAPPEPFAVGESEIEQTYNLYMYITHNTCTLRIIHVRLHVHVHVCTLYMHILLAVKTENFLTCIYTCFNER